MDRLKIEDQLVIDEGKRLVWYRDSLGKPTIGIGHLILASDNLPEGSTISEQRCGNLFQEDLDKAIAGATGLFPYLYSFPEPIQESIVNMVFNMGAKGLAKFRNFIAAINNSNYNEAADQLVDSLWYKQVGKRAVRIVAAVRGCADTGEETIIQSQG
jgi:lysozyme